LFSSLNINNKNILKNILKNSSNSYNDKMKYFENEAMQQKERADNLVYKFIIKFVKS